MKKTTGAVNVTRNDIAKSIEIVRCEIEKLLDSIKSKNASDEMIRQVKEMEKKYKIVRNGVTMIDFTIYQSVMKLVACDKESSVNSAILSRMTQNMTNMGATHFFESCYCCVCPICDGCHSCFLSTLSLTSYDKNLHYATHCSMNHAYGLFSVYSDMYQRHDDESKFIGIFDTNKSVNHSYNNLNTEGYTDTRIIVVATPNYKTPLFIAYFVRTKIVSHNGKLYTIYTIVKSWAYERVDCPHSNEYGGCNTVEYFADNIHWCIGYDKLWEETGETWKTGEETGETGEIEEIEETHTIDDKTHIQISVFDDPKHMYDCNQMSLNLLHQQCRNNFSDSYVLHELSKKTILEILQCLDAGHDKYSYNSESDGDNSDGDNSDGDEKELWQQIHYDLKRHHY